MSYQLEDVILITETEKAILFREHGIAEADVERDVNEWWIPKSVIEDMDDFYLVDNENEEGEIVGCVEVADWFAKKMEWCDEGHQKDHGDDDWDAFTRGY